MKWMLMVWMCFDGAPDSCVQFVDINHPLIYSDFEECKRVGAVMSARAHEITATGIIGVGRFGVHGDCIQQIEAHEPRREKQP